MSPKLGEVLVQGHKDASVLSMAMTKVGSHEPTWDPSHPNRTQLSFIDIKTDSYWTRDFGPCVCV